MTQQTRQRGRISAGALVLAATVMLTTTAACAQPRLEGMARDIRRSVPRTATSTVTGSIAIDFTGIAMKGATTSGAARFPVANAKFVAQPGLGRHALISDAGRVALSDHRVLYARRKLNGPADHRPWMRLEVERLEEVEVPRVENLMNQQDTGVLAVLSPGFVLDALYGVLTGSVKQQRLADGGRVFRFNVSIDKAERELELSEDQRDDNELLRRSIALTSDIFAVEATLRPDGSLAEAMLHIVERPDKRTRVDLAVVVKLDPPTTTAPPLWPPKRENTIRVTSLAAVRAGIVAELGPKVPVERPLISLQMDPGGR